MLEIIVNTAMIAEVSIRLVAFGKVSQPRAPGYKLQSPNLTLPCPDSLARRTFGSRITTRSIWL